ncbi:MAG: radical SAM protein [Leptolyngbyaceae bacterium]|nr:radical SAM protein [Leptolyngbyaceae bacterium]
MRMMSHSGRDAGRADTNDDTDIGSDRVLEVLSVYGPVPSWRFGRSLGIDPIGRVPTCSFGCVYCQLGRIAHTTDQRRIWVPTPRILADLQAFEPWDVDVITFSGSGEPTLALNLGELLREAKVLTQQKTVVLTNGSLLFDPQVRQDLAAADIVCAKLDAPSSHMIQLVNRPVSGVHLADILAGLDRFRQDFTGHFAIQTMMIAPWDETEQNEYIHHIQRIQPDEIQLNTPTRPRSLQHEIEARGNHTGQPPYASLPMKTVSASHLTSLAHRIQQATTIPVRCVPV